MEQVAEFEIELDNAIAAYVSEANTAAKSEPEYTIAALLEKKDHTSERFKEIKQTITNAKSELLSQEAKNTKLLISGEEDFKKYIRRHRLDSNYVVAVLNDTTLRDCDLIFTEKGLLIHEGESSPRKIVDIATLGIAYILKRFVGQVFCQYYQEIPYLQIDSNSEMLIKPSYVNKEVNMKKLFALLSDIKQGLEESTESKIRKAVKAQKREDIESSSEQEDISAERQNDSDDASISENNQESGFIQQSKGFTSVVGDSKKARVGKYYGVHLADAIKFWCMDRTFDVERWIDKQKRKRF